MVLKNPAIHIGSYTAEYGKKTYNMLQPQTDDGIAKFFSILRYLVGTWSDGPSYSTSWKTKEKVIKGNAITHPRSHPIQKMQPNPLLFPIYRQWAQRL